MMGTDQLPPVAVAMVNWNGWQDTIACLESLDRLRYPEPGLLLCDNASTDDSVQQIAGWAQGRDWSYRVVDHDPDGRERSVLDQGEPRLFIVRSGQNRGFAGGTNVAMRYALASRRSYSYIWALNTDTVVEPNSLAAAVRALEANPAAASAQSVLLWARRPELLDSAGMRLLRRGGAMDMLHHRPRAELEARVIGRDAVEIFGCCGAAALYRVSALRTVGLFDEALFHTHEDVDLACRLREHEHTALLVSGSIVHHVGGVSRDRQKRGLRWWTAHRNKLRVVARWYPSALAIPILAVGMVRAFAAAIRSSDVPFSLWWRLPGTLWRDWRGGATASVRRRIVRLGARGLIV